MNNNVTVPDGNCSRSPPVGAGAFPETEPWTPTRRPRRHLQRRNRQPGCQRRRGRSSEQPPQEKRVRTIPTGSRPDPLPRSRSGGHVTQMHLAGSTRLVLPAVDRPIASSASRSGSAHQRGVAVDDHQSTGASVDRLSTGVGSPSVSNAESISESASGSMWAAGQVRPRVSSR